MKLFVLTLVLLIGLVSARPEEKYTTKYDNIDIDKILTNDRLLNNYIDCLLDRGKCNPDAMELKNVVRDAVVTDCSKCNEKQKAGAKKVIYFLIKNKKSAWTELQTKYDPEQIFIKRYGDELKKDGITI